MRRHAWGWCCLLASFVLALPQAEAKSVLVLHGLEWRANTIRVFDQVLREELGVLKPGSDLHYYTEFIEGTRFPGEVQEQRFADFLRQRYSDVKVDAIVAMDPTSLRFMARHRDRIFPGTPLAYAGLRDATLSRFKLPADFVGSSYPTNARGTVELALRLRPQARELVIITGTAELDLSIEEQLRQAATELAPNLKLRVLTGLPFESIVEEIPKLPRDALVITGPFLRDGTGQAFTSLTVLLDRIRDITPVPIVHTFENAVGRGALASYSLPIEAVPRQAAAVARQLLAGVAPSSVVLPPPVQLVAFVDWRQLKRWDIPESLLPPDTVVRFRELTFWDQYRYEAIGIASAVLLQSMLIALLLVQRRRRTRAESTLLENEQSMKLAADAANLSMWSWDIVRDRISRVSSPGHFPRETDIGISLGTFLAAIHPEDREAVRLAVRRALDGDGRYESEYRVVDSAGNVHWYAGRGRVERDPLKPLRLLGVTLDITQRKLAELEAQLRRNELAHLSRVTMVGELSGSIAHELNQPLTAILANAQAAQMFIRRETVDLVEIESILDDIVLNDKRAGGIIKSLRKMLKKEDSAQEVLAVDELVHDVLRLIHNDLVNRHVTVETHLGAQRAAVFGDRTQLQQVVINLLLNGCDSMSDLPRAERILVVSSEVVDSRVRVTVSDCGSGIAQDKHEEIFAPFFTTKPQGLGLGLAICRTIMTSHGGQLTGRNNRDRGASFTLVLAEHSAAAKAGGESC
ncbi:Adaptive-response sensory-kinase SasA [Usitatibacter rugosus]|uniref:histidine kinase n=1 Tax=Usitatibacter rugosus TaxID=2732067 RepID=A0A6M4GT06_9PROT|nr:ATP-binding protein [Usitatibacter rugosus]QJR10460.1 Adaptive-response sensory-kinase SasA [Usitatibacter rugosus]